MAQFGIVNVDHRGDGCKAALEQLPEAFGRYGDPAIRNTGARRTSLVVGDVEWNGYHGVPHYVEIKLASDFITSIKSGHMSEQEMTLVEVGGVSKVLVVGQVVPHGSDPSLTLTSPSADPFSSKWVEHVFAYSGYLNYMVHLQEIGIDVIKIDSIDHIGVALAGIYVRSLRSPRGERIIKRKVVSVSNEANAVKALYPNLRLDVKACETLAQVAGVKLGTEWLDEMRAERGGELLIKEVVEALPGVGRPTIKRLFGV